MGKTFKRNDEDYEEMSFRESRKEAKIKKRRQYEESEYATFEERRK